MTKRLNRIAPLQLGIVLAALYGALSLILVPFILVGATFAPRSTADHGFLAGSLLFGVLIPFLYAAGGFIGGVIMAAVYNLIAGWTGGIEVTLVDVPPPLNG